MFDDSTTQCLLFPEIFAKPAVLQFDQLNGSSDGGAILLKAADRRYGLIQALAGCLRDKRQAGKVDHSLRELLAQRVFSIACGYPDANDSARLSADPIHKMLLDRDPVTGRDLASQPTLSRFENAIRPRELYRLGEALADSVIERHAQRLRGRARLVTIDLDPTDDPTHGAQQLSFFNGHYDSWCYLPVMGFVSFNDEAEQYLCAAVLRPGNVTAAVGAEGILRRLITMISYSFPGARIRVRLDGGFAHPDLLDFLEDDPNLEYVIAMAKNAVLKRKAKPAMRQARRLSRQTGKTEHVYGEAQLCGQNMAATTPHHHQGRSGARRGKEAEGQSALRHHQHEAESAVALRRGVLPAWRNREQNQRTARSPDRPHQLQRLLGQPAPRPADRCRVRADAGATTESRAYQLRSRSGLDSA